MLKISHRFSRVKIPLLFLGLVSLVPQLGAERQAVCKGADILLFTDNLLPATLYRNDTTICVWISTGNRSKGCEKRVLRDEISNIRLYNVSTNDSGIYKLMSWKKVLGESNLLVLDECNAPVVTTEEYGIYGIYKIIFGIVALVLVLSLLANIVVIPRYWRLRKRQYSKENNDVEQNGKELNELDKNGHVKH